ncbi:gliding motility-associated C-terminal domain-containing protein, partial [Flavobacterium sp. LS2P90]
CTWKTTGTQPAEPTTALACWETRSFDTTSCTWKTTGTKPAEPTTACYETATFNTTTCAWDVTGTKPAAPTTACYETATFNTTTCAWDVTGTQTVEPIVLNSVCNSDTKLTIDLKNLLPVGTPLNGTWTDVDNTGKLEGSVFSPFGLNIRNYYFEYKAAGENCPSIIKINISDDCGSIVLGCGIVAVHNAFSPNGDGINENFIIDNIDDINCYPDNSMEIYNRWGVKVFETTGYNNTTRVFNGISQGRTTISDSSGLPTGTYFYILIYTSVDNNGNLQTNKKDGYLYLTK